MSAPYVLRPYGRALDRDFVVSHWLRSFATSRHGRRWGANVPDSDTRSVWWQTHEVTVRACLERGETTLLCPSDEPDVILAFCCTEGPDVVHYVLAKNRFHQRGLSADLFRALLGDRLERPQRVSHELVEMNRAGMMMPAQWRLDEYYLARKVA